LSVNQGLKIGLFLVASPSLGSEYANMLNLISSAMGNTQASALKFSQNNVWLNDLDKDFMNLKNGKLQIEGKELIEDLPLYIKGFIRKQIVEPFSGTKYFGNSFKVPNSDHSTIAKPADNNAIQHRLLVQFTKDLHLVTKNKLGSKNEVIKTQLERIYSVNYSGLILLYSDIDRRLRQLLGHGSQPLYQSHSMQRNLEILNEWGSLPSYLMSHVSPFLNIYSQASIGVDLDLKILSSAIDSGITILKIIQAFPYSPKVVYHPGVKIYSDKEGTQVRDRVKGVLLEVTSPNGSLKTLQIFPTTCTHLMKGKEVLDCMNDNQVWEESWYRDPDTNEVKQAWIWSLEFIGRHLDDL
jgi:hypothetical protein